VYVGHSKLLDIFGEQMIENNKFEEYFSHLRKISLTGLIYKRFFSSPILYFCARRFGRSIVEVGSGTGNGILGAFPKSVCGLEINSISVDYCKSKGMNVDLIDTEGRFPVRDHAFDVCILDNVLEHIEEPRITLDECYRVTKKNGGLIIVVPGLRGFQSDSDHKIFYGVNELANLDGNWQLINFFSMPFIIKCERLSTHMRQYCLVATYKKV